MFSGRFKGIFTGADVFKTCFSAFKLKMLHLNLSHAKPNKKINAIFSTPETLYSILIFCLLCGNHGRTPIRHYSQIWKKNANEITNLSCHRDISCPICCLALRGVTGRQRLRPRPPVVFSFQLPIICVTRPLKTLRTSERSRLFTELRHRCQPLLFRLHAHAPPLQDEEA